MKLIVTESQYRIIMENENNFDNYFPVSDKELNTESGISKLLTRYKKLKNKFGFNKSDLYLVYINKILTQK